MFERLLAVPDSTILKQCSLLACRAVSISTISRCYYYILRSCFAYRSMTPTWTRQSSIMFSSTASHGPYKINVGNRLVSFVSKFPKENSESMSSVTRFVSSFKTNTRRLVFYDGWVPRLFSERLFCKVSDSKEIDVLATPAWKPRRKLL